MGLYGFGAAAHLPLPVLKTRADARDFLQLAARIKLAPAVTAFPLDHVNEALRAVKSDAIDGAAVITIG